MKLLYLCDYKEDEEATLSQLGIKTARISVENAKIDTVPEGSYVVRGPRISASQYERIWNKAAAAGIKIATTPESYRIGLSFKEQYEALGQYSPRAVILDASTAPSVALQTLLNEGMDFPVFLRSELGSAAKAVGVEGCIVSQPELSHVTETMENLRRYIQEFNTLIFKEVVELARHEGSGEPIEYRAIGIGGSLLGFDIDQQEQHFPLLEKWGLPEFASKALNSLAAYGGDGGFFVDVALSSSRTPLVVECKNLLNGTIKNIMSFGAAVKAL